jgi:hypothetical protein
MAESMPKFGPPPSPSAAALIAFSPDDWRFSKKRGSKGVRLQLVAFHVKWLKGNLPLMRGEARLSEVVWILILEHNKLANSRPRKTMLGFCDAFTLPYDRSDCVGKSEMVEPSQ